MDAAGVERAERRDRGCDHRLHVGLDRDICRYEQAAAQQRDRFATCLLVNVRDDDPELLLRKAELERAGEKLPEPMRAELLDPDEVADAVIRFIEDDSLAGRVLMLVGGAEPRLL